jgi:hypothetical protein
MKLKYSFIALSFLINVNLLVRAENIIFPTLKGDDLTGKSIQIPKDSMGKPTFVILGYSYKAREKSDKWLIEYEKHLSDNTNFYLIPMMGNKTSTKAMSFFINSAMKNGTPAKEQSHVITVYEDLNPIKKVLSFDEKEDLYVYLLDSKGNIVWSDRGSFNYKSFRTLQDKIKSLK